MEASFDIIYEDHQTKGTFFEAEVIMVLCQVMALLKTQMGEKIQVFKNLHIKSPCWYFRLTNTRLADAILDVCGVPTDDSIRQECFNILTCCSACPPSVLLKTNFSQFNKAKLDVCLEQAISRHSLSTTAAERIRSFLLHGCLPLPINVNDALNSLQAATKMLRSKDDQKQPLSRKTKRQYGEVAKGIRNLRDLFLALSSLGVIRDDVGPSVSTHEHFNGNLHPPTFVSLDLGLRQRRKHFHGQLYFQAIILEDSCFNNAEENIGNNNDVIEKRAGLKIAEGGRYDNLVRKFRSPGNFGSSQIDQYITSIHHNTHPMCIGVRFSIGKLVERTYLKASLSASTDSMQLLNKGVTASVEIELLRRAYGYPLQIIHPIKCIVASMYGMDSDSLPDRAIVAARLFAEGISTEYISQSGVMMSLLKHKSSVGDQYENETNEWTLDQLCDVCDLIRIPFVVIVFPHCLKEMGTVRLRSTLLNNLTSKEIHLDSLAPIIKDSLIRLGNASLTSGTQLETNESCDRQKSAVVLTSSRETSARVSSPAVSIECIYVDEDQFHVAQDKLPGNDSDRKGRLKLIKSSIQRAGLYLSNLCDVSTSQGGCGTPVLATKLPFLLLREFGTIIMSRHGSSVVDSSSELFDRYPKRKKHLKSLAMSVDYLLRRQDSMNSTENGKSRSGHPEVGKNRSGLFTVFLYSICDDRFDLVTLEKVNNPREIPQRSVSDISNSSTTRQSKRDRGRW